MGSNEFIFLVINNPNLYLFALCIALALTISLKKFLRVQLIGGMAMCHIYLIVNMATIIFCAFTSLARVEDLFQFFIAEIALYIVVACLYRRISQRFIFYLGTISPKAVISISIATIITILLFSLYSILVAGDNPSSRVEYQLVSPSFTFIKPFIYIATSISLFLPFIQNKLKISKVLIALTLLSVVVGSMISGSKGGFLFGFMSTFLLLKEFGYFKTNFGKKIAIPKTFFFILGAGFLLNLYILNVQPIEMLVRVAYNGDSVFMTYPNVHPEDLCTGVDPITAYHRGLSRLLGLPAALDPNSIFGVRLVKQVELEDAMRGPNARVSSYSFCHFGTFGTFPFILYLGFLLTLQYRLLISIINRRPVLSLLIVPFFITLLSIAAQDVYQVMTGFIIMIVSWLLFNILSNLRIRN